MKSQSIKLSDLARLPMSQMVGNEIHRVPIASRRVRDYQSKFKNSITQYVGPSVGWSVRSSFTLTSSAFTGVFVLLLLPICLINLFYRYPCLPIRDLCSQLAQLPTLVKNTNSRFAYLVLLISRSFK